MREAGDFNFIGKNGKSYTINVFGGKKRPPFEIFKKLEAAQREGSKLMKLRREDAEEIGSSSVRMGNIFISILSEVFSKTEPNFFSVERGEIDEYCVLSDKGRERMSSFVDMDPIEFLIRCGVVASEAGGTANVVTEEQIKELIRKVANELEGDSKIHGDNEASASSLAEKGTEEITPENLESVSEQSPD